MSPAYANDGASEEPSEQAEPSDTENADDSGREHDRQDRSAVETKDGEASEDEADSHEVKSNDRTEAPTDVPASVSPDKPSKPARADSEPAAAPQKPVAAGRALPKEIQSKDASQAAPAPSVAPSQQTAQPASVKSQTEATATTASQHDVYSERTDKILEAESKQASEKVHPLQLRYPDHNVIVCTAGCGPGGTVVHKQAKAERGLVETAVMVPSAASASAPPEAASDDTMTCIAGCFTTPRKLRVLEKRADLVKITAPAAAAAVPSSASPAAIADKLSGKWTSTPASAVQPAAKSAVPAKPGQPGQMGSGDWMERINSERKEETPKGN